MFPVSGQDCDQIIYESTQSAAAEVEGQFQILISSPSSSFLTELKRKGTFWRTVFCKDKHIQ